MGQEASKHTGVIQLLNDPQQPSQRSAVRNQQAGGPSKKNKITKKSDADSGVSKTFKVVLLGTGEGMCTRKSSSEQVFTNKIFPH